MTGLEMRKFVEVGRCPNCSSELGNRHNTEILSASSASCENCNIIWFTFLKPIPKIEGFLWHKK